jgi:hypothetical protein
MVRMVWLWCAAASRRPVAGCASRKHKSETPPPLQEPIPPYLPNHHPPVYHTRLSSPTANQPTHSFINIPPIAVDGQCGRTRGTPLILYLSHPHPNPPGARLSTLGLNKRTGTKQTLQGDYFSKAIMGFLDKLQQSESSLVCVGYSTESR